MVGEIRTDDGSRRGEPEEVVSDDGRQREVVNK